MSKWEADNKVRGGDIAMFKNKQDKFTHEVVFFFFFLSFFCFVLFLFRSFFMLDVIGVVILTKRKIYKGVFGNTKSTK